MIPVTKPFSPPISDYTNLLEGIWERNWFTNNGPLVKELEAKLKNHLGLENLLFVGNGTIALQLALKALNITKEVITTPFSYVATTSSIVWEGCKPVFVDIDGESLNIDPSKIEAAITEDTQAILATHCFGNPCDIDAIDLIAKKHGLKVIYDAAHCFGVEYKGKSIFSYGDISTTSFHATKLFHTIEGGAVFTQDEKLINKLMKLRNFGHNGPEKFAGVGINGKNSEFHAAMGIVNLKYVEGVLEMRKKLCYQYDDLFKSLKIQKQKILSETTFNYAYYPIVFESEEIALNVKNLLDNNEIHPRRYFYPSLSTLDYVSGQETPVANDIASRILCFPLYHDLKFEEQKFLASLIKESNIVDHVA